jgi:Tripartite tricarboxylate transporter family receptor
LGMRCCLGRPGTGCFAETVPGYEVSVWNGIVVPKGTPSEIIDKLNGAVNAVLADPKLKTRFAELGGEPMPMTPVEFGKLVVQRMAASEPSSPRRPKEDTAADRRARAGALPNI